MYKALILINLSQQGLRSTCLKKLIRNLIGTNTVFTVQEIQNQMVTPPTFWNCIRKRKNSLSPHAFKNSLGGLLQLKKQFLTDLFLFFLCNIVENMLKNENRTEHFILTHNQTLFFFFNLAQQMSCCTNKTNTVVLVQKHRVIIYNQFAA